jgi:predicted RNase H-like nuclease (RuvC/YqgF family)
MTKEALKLALEAFDSMIGRKPERVEQAITAIKEALAQDQFKPDYNTEAVLVEEMQQMAKRIEDLEAMLERQTARIVDLQTHIENLEGEE